MKRQHEIASPLRLPEFAQDHAGLEVKSQFSQGPYVLTKPCLDLTGFRTGRFLMIINGQKAEKLLLYLTFLFFSLYVINAVGNMECLEWVLGKRRYLNVLWVLLGLYLIVSRGRVSWSFFWANSRLVVPVVVALYIYHGRAFDLSYVKYVLLLILVGSVICQIKGFSLREFFIVNSASCLVVFFSALYQIYGLGYLVPNGDLNQNIFACLVMAIGNVSLFAVLYRERLKRGECLIYALCGVLAIWVSLRTSCRTSYVTELVLMMLFSYWAQKKCRYSISRVAGFIVLAFAFMGLVLIASPDVTEYKFRAIWVEIKEFFGLEVGEKTGSSVGLRLAMWKAAVIDIIPHHFFFGVGDIRKQDWLTLLPKSSIDSVFLAKLSHFHNEGINTFVMGGMLLFATSIWLLYRLFIVAKSDPVLLCLLVGSVTWGMTEVAFRHKPFLIVFLSIWLLYECATHNERMRKGNALGN